MSNVGKIIQDNYCNGFAGRRYDLYDAVIEVDGNDYIVIRTVDKEPIFISFVDWYKDRQKLIDAWCSTEPYDVR